MMQAGIRVSVTCTSSAVTSIRRDEPLPTGASSQGDLLDKADFRPTPAERAKSFTALGGVRLQAKAPKWALNPIKARVEAPEGRVVVTKAGGDPLGQWSPIGIRPTFEWCLVLPADVSLGLEPTEVTGTLVAFLPNGGDIDANVRKVAQSCTPADVDRYRAILAARAQDAKKSAEEKSRKVRKKQNDDGGDGAIEGDDNGRKRPGPPPPPGPRPGTPPGPPRPTSSSPSGPPSGLKPPRLS